MHLDINSNSSIKVSLEEDNLIKDMLRVNFERYKDSINRISVHLSDMKKSGPDSNNKKCLIEARVNGRKNIVVHSTENNLMKSISFSIEKLKHSLIHEIDKKNEIKHQKARI